ncbi:MAG: acyl-CoA thioesterase [Pseudomonadota bacterium]
MYPVIRMFWQMHKHRNAGPLEPLGVNVSHHYCLPWDIDLWMELNNGRTLTLFDLGRVPMAIRVGLVGIMRRNKWSLAVAGACVRYRRRIRMFEKIEMRSRMTCWDEKFIYVEQSMWKQDGECACHAVFRIAMTSKTGIVPPPKIIDEMGVSAQNPVPPLWIANWIKAESERPWPPMQE